MKMRGKRVLGKKYAKGLQPTTRHTVFVLPYSHLYLQHTRCGSTASRINNFTANGSTLVAMMMAKKKNETEICRNRKQYLHRMESSITIDAQESQIRSSCVSRLSHL